MWWIIHHAVITETVDHQYEYIREITRDIPENYTTHEEYCELDKNNMIAYYNKPPYRTLLSQGKCSFDVQPIQSLNDM